jgi:hypothetical protein
MGARRRLLVAAAPLSGSTQMVITDSTYRGPAFEERLDSMRLVLFEILRYLTNVAADKHFSDAASPQW